MMFPAIDNPASCEISALICFLHAKIMSAAEIHSELCAAVYCQNVMSEGTVRQRCSIFKDGRTNVHDEERSDQPSIVSDEFFKVLTKNIVKDGTSQFQNFRANIHKFHSLFMRLSQLGYAITSFVQDGFRKCSRVRTKRRKWLQL
jgi:hypothetical protein